MAKAARKTELSPIEDIVVERTLGDEARNANNNLLARIQQLTQERQRLYARSAGRPLTGPANGLRIREIGAEIEMLWEVLRRERAQRRVQIERALNVIADEDEGNEQQPNAASASDASDAA